jgi:hypothetical protein
MTFTLDPEMAAALAPMADAMEDPLLLAVGDVATRRATFEPMMGQANGAPGGRILLVGGSRTAR